MALSSSSRYCSHIIREVSRDPNKTNHSCASSTGSHHGTISDSTVSDFDPENEAIMSTRQLDLNFSQKLPELRDTAKKYGRWTGSRQQDFAINTSAIGRAFPDFSQGGSSDDSMSIEVGRGAKTRQRTSSQQTRPQYSSIDSPIVTVGDFQILNTPPMKSRPKSSEQQDAPRSSTRKESNSRRTSVAQKENIPPDSNPVSAKKTPDYVSGATRTSSGEQRRTLAELHAQVADESDGSFIGDERPTTVTFAAKSSRFANFQPRHSPLANVTNQTKQRVSDTLVDVPADRHNASRTQTPLKPPSNGTITFNTVNPTNQSFLLPNIPDISELVSGTFKNGTPVFTRGGKVQSRFSSKGTDWKASHEGLDGIPVPQEEKDIFLSLQLLQEKVASLEMEKADTQRILEDMQKENHQLHAEKEELQKRCRSESALGMADNGSDGECACDNQKLVAEKTKLEAQLRSLRSRLDANDRKISNLELRLKDNTTERDQAIKQLAEAFCSCEQLKSENELLKKENESLKKQLAQFVSEREENERRWQQKESSLRRKLQRRDDAVLEIKEMTREIQETQYENNVRVTAARASDAAATRRDKSKRTSSAQMIEQDIQPRVRAQILEPIHQLKASNGQKADRGRASSVQLSEGPQNQPESHMKSRSRSRSRRLGSNEGFASNVQKAVQIEIDENIRDNDTSEEGSFDDTTKTIHKDLNINGDEENRTRGSNYSSILGHGEMDRLRQILVNERAKQQERLAAAAVEQAAENDTVRSARSVGSTCEDKQTLQRKSSVKGLTSILKNRNTQDHEGNTEFLSVKSDGCIATGEDHITQSITSPQRRHSESSMDKRINSRRRIVAEGLTSAFILPDITIHSTSHATEHPALSVGARRVLDNLAQHDGHNCTVCSRVASFDIQNATINIDTKKTVRIEKPVPVSDRMPVAGPYEDEPTMRPSTTPGLALATVMKGVQDELAHLKMELAQYQAMYNKHDMSLGMRKRKSLKVKIENLLKAIDTKADQIYALFDVLEGQKQSGQELSEQEVEVTLQSIGVDVGAFKKKGMPVGDDHNSDNDSEEDSELDLPWEGIEDTTGTESGNGRRQSWHV